MIDKYTQECIGIPGLVLMEKAAEVLADEIDKRIASGEKSDKLYGFRKPYDKILAVVEGGNNGGDAVAAARILKTKGYDTYVYEINGIKNKTESYIKQIEIAKKLGVGFVDDLSQISDFRVIIDGIFGVGLTREVTGIQSDAINMINAVATEGIFIAATDISSGISSDTGEILGNAVNADLTVTFQYIKYGMLIGKGREASGAIVCRDIGLYDAKSLSDMKKVLDTDESLADQKLIYEFDDEDIASRIPKRDSDSNKGTYGKVLILAGSKDVYGALYLSAEVCLRTGAGLVKVVTDERNKAVLSEKLPESMCLTYDTDEVTESKTFAEEYKKAISWADVVLAGPGLGTGDASRMLLELMMENISSGKQLILDADALNILAESGKEKWLKLLRDKLGYENVIITPHLAEMSRLTGDKVEYIKDNKFDVAKRFTDEFGAITILKDARTVVSCTGYLSDKKEMPAYINTTGNSGMSTAGSGDVLSGILAGILAQNKDERITAYEAACLAVNIHGRAGDLARDTLGEHGLIAGDIIAALPAILR